MVIKFLIFLKKLFLASFLIDVNKNYFNSSFKANAACDIQQIGKA